MVRAAVAGRWMFRAMRREGVEVNWKIASVKGDAREDSGVEREEGEKEKGAGREYVCRMHSIFLSLLGGCAALI